jgi:hypothetical protein
MNSTMSVTACVPGSMLLVKSTRETGAGTGTGGADGGAGSSGISAGTGATGTGDGTTFTGTTSGGCVSTGTLGMMGCWTSITGGGILTGGGGGGAVCTTVWALIIAGGGNFTVGIVGWAPCEPPPLFDDPPFDDPPLASVPPVAWVTLQLPSQPGAPWASGAATTNMVAATAMAPIATE